MSTIAGVFLVVLSGITALFVLAQLKNLESIQKKSVVRVLKKLERENLIKPKIK